MSVIHPTHNSRSTYAWMEKGAKFAQPAVSGRDRVNINGLLNAKDVTDLIAVDSESINAQSTREMYRMALEKHPDAEKIYIISDNAEYYRNRVLTEWLKGGKITQIFLPPYSPNLNLIERLWRFLRKKVINTEFYRTKELFKQAIDKFFKNIANVVSMENRREQSPVRDEICRKYCVPDGTLTLPENQYSTNILSLSGLT